MDAHEISFERDTRADAALEGGSERESSPVLPSIPRPLQGHPTRRTRPVLPSRFSSHKRPVLRHRKSSGSGLAQQEADAAVEADLAAAFNTSSDPAFFSSDETPDLENYTLEGGKRKKKVYTGTWWSGRLRSGSNNSGKSSGSEKCKSVSFRAVDSTKRRKKERELRRNFDSGIFMADEIESAESSGMDLSSDGLLEEMDAERTRTLERLQANDTLRGEYADGLSAAAPKLFKKLALREIIPQKPDPRDIKIDEIIQQCLEKGEVDVDLTNMGIKDLPASITSLRTLVRSRDPINLPFAPLSGRVRIYLANNQLSLFPGRLLQIPNTELLSLRQNQLTVLPDSIVELKNLRELNISGNELEYLPFGVLKMCHIKLRTMQSEPNPWRPIPSPSQHLHDLPQIALNEPTRSIRRVAVEIATTLLANGTKIREISHPRRNASYRGSRAPSLSEVILKQLDRFHTAGTDLSQSPDTQVCSDNVRSMLHQLYRYQYEGRRLCTFCERPVILPRYQWLEWWRIVDFDVSRGEVNNDPRYQVITRVSEDGQREASDGESVSDKGEDHEDVAVHDLTRGPGKLLPFLRVSCGCSTQQEGLDEERALFAELAASCKETSNNGYRMWPTPKSRKSIVI